MLSNNCVVGIFVLTSYEHFHSILLTWVYCYYILYYVVCQLLYYSFVVCIILCANYYHSIYMYYVIYATCCWCLQVTADGSLDCQLSPSAQEMIVYPLLLCEVYVALSLLDSGGSAVFKMFTLFESHTVALMYLLCLLFDTVSALW